MRPECLLVMISECSLMRSECLLTISEPRGQSNGFWKMDMEVRFNTDQAPNICWAPWQVGHL